MAFVPLSFDEGKVLELQCTASTTFTKHALVKYSSGYLTNAADGDDEVEYVALEAKVTGASNGELLKVLPIDETILFEALCSATPVQATHVGNAYDLDDDKTVKVGTATDKLFHIHKISNAGSLLVIGNFNKPGIA